MSKSTWLAHVSEDGRRQTVLEHSRGTARRSSSHAGNFGAGEQGELAGGDSADEIAEYLMISVRGLVYNWCTKGGAYNLTAATRRFAVRLLKAYQPT